LSHNLVRQRGDLPADGGLNGVLEIALGSAPVRFGASTSSRGSRQLSAAPGVRHQDGPDDGAAQDLFAQFENEQSLLLLIEGVSERAGHQIPACYARRASQVLEAAKMVPGHNSKEVEVPAMQLGER
jgi:hypothetical protein